MRSTEGSGKNNGPGPGIWPLGLSDGWITDSFGRKIIMKGLNVAGSSKLPMVPDGSSYRPDSLKNPETVSFVGRPFPLDEADDHYARIAGWGFKFLRFLVSWEAVEHAEPGNYDGEYLDYLEAVAAKAGEHGLGLWIDPHQDVWSRWTGGDGAPAWTLETAGMDLEKIVPTGSALVHSLFEGEGVFRDQIHRIERAREKNIPLADTIKESFRESGPAGPRPPLTYPGMIWPTNYTRYACATMFTLFFGGEIYAPSFSVEKYNIQTWLQDRYFDMVRTVASRLARFPHVIGFGSMNEPHRGYIGWQDLNRQSVWLMKNGPTPTGIEGMAAASGCKQYVRTYRFSPLGPIGSGYTHINDDEEILWKPGYECPWKREGVWDFVRGKPVLKKPEYFAHIPGSTCSGAGQEKTISFSGDFLKPFLKRFHTMIEGIDRRFLVFIEAVPSEPHPSWDPETDGSRAVNGSHWYDAYTLISKRLAPRIAFDAVKKRPVFGKRRVQRSFIRQIRHQAEAADFKMGGIPTVIGEFGVPFDLKNSNAFADGDYSGHEHALSSYYRAMDRNLIGSFLWNYCPDNSNLLGDRWNDEDLSIYSADGPAGRTDGGRAVKGFLRPYAAAVCGTPQRVFFDPKSRTFEFRSRPDTACGGPPPAGETLLFIPRELYPEGFSAEVSSGDWSYSETSQMLTVSGVRSGEVLTVRITPAGL